MLEWMVITNARDKISIYCSDVSGAFDRVNIERLVQQMRAKGINERIVKLLTSWLQERVARVIVGGTFSITMKLLHQVFQGTVLGPLLWNIFFEDANLPIRKSGFNEIIFADDLNAWRRYRNISRNATIMKHGKQCQAALHTWGRANQSSFDSNKESFSIISQSAPEGPSFKLLGVVFDTKLKMEEAVATLSNEMVWKLRNLLRTQRYFDTKSLVHLFKSRILGYVD